MKKVRKGLLMIIGVCVLCTCCVLGSKTDTVQAAMADEAEDYEMQETESCITSAAMGWKPRYFRFTIPERSHVTLKARISDPDGTLNEYSIEGCYIDIFDSNGKEVLKSSDLQYTENKTTGVWSTSRYKNLNKGTYYIECSTSSGGRRLFTFWLQAEKQIKLSKGSIKYLKSKKRGQMTIQCNNATNAIGYRIQYSTDYRFKRGVKTVYSPTKSKTIKGLKKGKRYYVKVCPYTVYDDGTWVFGQNSYVRAVLVK